MSVFKDFPGLENLEKLDNKVITGAGMKYYHIGYVLFQNLINLDGSERNALRSQSNLTCSDASE